MLIKIYKFTPNKYLKEVQVLSKNLPKLSCYKLKIRFVICSDATSMDLQRNQISSLTALFMYYTITLSLFYCHLYYI